MADYERNKGKPWSKGDLSLLKSLAEANTPTRVIAFKLGRTVGSVYSKASEQGVSLKPTKQSPYNRIKK